MGYLNYVCSLLKEEKWYEKKTLEIMVKLRRPLGNSSGVGDICFCLFLFFFLPLYFSEKFCFIVSERSSVVIFW